VLSFFKSRRKVQILQRDVCRLSPEEWRADPDMVKLARAVLNDPRFRLMLDCVYFAHPANAIYGKISIEDRALVQAQSQGYTIALACFKSLGVNSQLAQDLGDPTYEPPELETEAE